MKEVGQNLYLRYYRDMQDLENRYVTRLQGILLFPYRDFREDLPVIRPIAPR